MFLILEAPASIALLLQLLKVVIPCITENAHTEVFFPPPFLLTHQDY